MILVSGYRNGLALFAAPSAFARVTPGPFGDAV